MAHSSVVGGSTAARVMGCPYSVSAIKDMPPQPENAYMLEGTVCHAIMETALLSGELRSEVIGQTIQGVAIDKDLFYNKLQPAWDATQEAIQRFDITEIIPEAEVHLTSIEGAFGTCDILAKGRDDLVVLLDYKFGFNEVSAVRNSQLLFYAAAALEDAEYDDLFTGSDTQPVVLGIIQPNVGGALRTWETTVGYIRKFAGGLMLAVEMSTLPDIKPNAGDWCKYCPKAATCPAHITSAQATLRLNEEGILDLTTALGLAQQLEPWVKSVYKLAHEQLERGDSVEGWKLVQKRARRAWVDEADVMDKVRPLKKLLLDDVTKRTLLSPAQIQLVCKAKGVDFKMFTDYIESKSSGTSLVTEDDERQGVVVSGKRVIPEHLK